MFAKNRLNENESLWEMANLIPKRTGLDYIIWIQPRTNKEQHWARIKVQVDKENRVPVTISDNPEWKSTKAQIKAKDWNHIRDWIIANKTILLEYWESEGEMDIQYVLDRLKMV